MSKQLVIVEWNWRISPQPGCFQGVSLEEEWLDNSGILFSQNDRCWFCVVTLGKKGSGVFSGEGRQQGGRMSHVKGDLLVEPCVELAANHHPREPQGRPGKGT